MSTDNVVQVGGVVVAILGAITAFIAALRPLLLDILTELRANRAELRKNTAVTEDTHVMINSQRDAARDQQTRTDNLLLAAGIDLPFNPAAHIQVEGTEESDKPRKEILLLA